MNKPQAKKLPKFKNEDEEREFWDTHSSVDYFDLENAVLNPSMPKLKPSTEMITIRMSSSLLDRIKMEANQRDIGYQTLIKERLFDMFVPKSRVSRG